MTQFVAKPFAFLRGEIAVGAGKSLVDANPCLLGFKAPRLLASQFTTADALVDADLFTAFGLIDGRMCR